MTASRGAGRYAPSPSGNLHIGNLRTALIAWSLAGQAGLEFAMRVEDIDRVRAGAADRQLHDLRALGLTWRQPTLFQSTRGAAHLAALQRLADRGLTYECYCSRKDILAAPSAPHSPPGTYPGTCRDLSATDRAAGRERLAAAGRSPSIRLRSHVDRFEVRELVAGVGPAARADETTGYRAVVDDFVLRRGDGVLAYNLVAVVDDAFQGVTQVCRGDDLLPSAPRQAYLATLLGYRVPEYAHVPLVVNADGNRLAKRDGAVTLMDLAALGWSVGDVISWCSRSLGLKPATTAIDFAARCTLPALRRAGGPHVFEPPNVSR